MTLGNFIKRFRDITRNDSGINGDAQRIEQLTWMLFLKIYDDMEVEREILDDTYQSIVPEGMRWNEWANTDDDKARKGSDLLQFVDGELFPALQNLDLPPNCPKYQSVIKSVFEDIHNYMKDGVLLHQVLQLINERDASNSQNGTTFLSNWNTSFWLLPLA